MAPQPKRRVSVTIDADLVAAIRDAAREQVRWATARQITSEMAEEAGVTEEDKALARSVLRVDGEA